MRSRRWPACVSRLRRMTTVFCNCRPNFRKRRTRSRKATASLPWERRPADACLRRTDEYRTAGTRQAGRVLHPYHAQAQAETLINNAKLDAQHIVDDANAKAASILTNASNQAESVTTSANEDAAQLRSETAKTITEQRQTVELELSNAREEHTKKMLPNAPLKSAKSPT